MITLKEYELPSRIGKSIQKLDAILIEVFGSWRIGEMYDYIFETE